MAAVTNAPKKAKPVAKTVSQPVAWAIAFLKYIGAPVTPNNIATIIKWGTAESGAPGGSGQVHGGWRNNNPLNIVRQPGDGAVGQGGSQGNIADFGDVNTGAKQAARLFMGNSNAAPIIAALRADASAGVVQSAVNRFYSSWGGSISFAGITADTTSSPTGATTVGIDLGPITVPTPGDLWSGAKATADAAGAVAGLASGVLGVFSNWRYVAEVFIGGWLVIIGAWIIIRDVTGKPIVPSAQGVAQGAATAAMVAA